MVAVLGFAGLLRAEPLDLKQVDAEAKWAIHVDFDAARASTVLTKAYQFAAQKHPKIEKRLAEVREKWHFDPAQLQGLTFYGLKFKKGEGVAIVHAKLDEQMLLEKAKKAPGHQTSKHGKYELHTWTQDAGSKHERSLTAVFFRPDLLLFGGSQSEVAAALDVLDGTKPSVAAKMPSLAETIKPGTVLWAGARDLSEIKIPPQCPVRAPGQAGSVGDCLPRRAGGPSVSGRDAGREAGRGGPAVEGHCGGPSRGGRAGPRRRSPGPEDYQGPEGCRQRQTGHGDLDCPGRPALGPPAKAPPAARR